MLFLSLQRTKEGVCSVAFSAFEAADACLPVSIVSHERPCLTTFPNTEMRFENTTRSGVFLTSFEVFGNVVKHRLECLIYLLNQNYN